MAHVCSFCGSTHRVSRFQGGELFCLKHYLQMRSHGEVFTGKRQRMVNQIVHTENECKIITSKGDEILVDSDELKLLSAFNWCVSAQGYAVSKTQGNLVRMHRLIMNCEEGLVVDHINGNRLDNRRENLRICTAKNNSRNKGTGRNNQSGIQGVSRCPNGCWRARIMVDRKEKSLGCHDSFESAVKARREAEKKYFGKFAQSSRLREPEVRSL